MGTKEEMTMTLTHTIKQRVAIAAIALCALGGAFTATVSQASAATQAAESNWYWSETLAKHRLKGRDIAWRGGGYTDVYTARCSGRGGYVWNDYGTERLFKRFVCTAIAGNGDVFTVELRVVNRFNFNVNLLSG
jgi:hypothetical protein